MEVIDDTNSWPVLVHCHHGVDRTGYIIALHRIINEGWTVDRALREAWIMGMSKSSLKVAHDTIDDMLEGLTNPVVRNARLDATE